MSKLSWSAPGISGGAGSRKRSVLCVCKMVVSQPGEGPAHLWVSGGGGGVAKDKGLGD